MLNKVVDQSIGRVPQLEDVGKSVAHGLHNAVLKGGRPARVVADVLHGAGTGHPLHAVLTDLAIGGWVMGLVFDVIWLTKGSRTARQAADTSILAGTISAIPTALSGLADFSTIPQASAGTGLVHGLLNIANVALYTSSLMLRKNRHTRRLGITVSMAATGILGLAAMLGGHLSYSQRVGANHDVPVDAMPEWTPAHDYVGLLDRQPKRVDVNGHPILLYKEDGVVYAISAVCSHEGGPLQEGKIENCAVECPWHQSVFSLRDGRVVHGPATQAVTGYEARVNDGRVEVRLLEPSI
jgi:nitrite reductase/ring-hydroxylating ferredoxin subunit/uncharacterized membrane protein